MLAMATNSSFKFKWLICCALTINGVLSGREDRESREEDITSMFSSSQSPILSVPPYICRLRVKIFGYECEEHKVTTKDGYILSIQRIPQGHSSSNIEGKNKEPVLLMHGLLMDGITWLVNPPNESLGFILADKGYDVWIANTRGTSQSRGHTFSSASHSDYWDWSWDELVSFDLPAIFEYVYSHTSQQKFHYIGHSLGSLIAFALFCQNNPWVKMVRSAVMLCPIAYVNQVSSAMVRAAADTFTAEDFYWLGIKEFIPAGIKHYRKDVSNLLKKICKEPGVNCSDLLTSFTGNNCCLKASSIHVFAKFEPQPTSTKLMIHISQMMRSGTIVKYDYNDYEKNMEHYGQPTPPAYNLSAIPFNLPLFFIYGGRDWLSDIGDIENLLHELRFHSRGKLKLHLQQDYAHVDFIMGFNAKEKIYEHVVEFIRLQ